VASIVLGAAALLPAGTFTAFGPEKYVRGQSAPAPVTKKFTIRDPSAPYTLRIENAGSFGASVTLNGKEIVNEGEFKSHDIVITKPVALLASNELVVLQRGQPGETFVLRITGIDNVPPVITITSPLEGAKVNTPTLVIRGTVTDQTSGVASLTCNGIAATVSEPNFTCSVPLKRGPNAITLRAVDFAENASTKILNVTLILVTITDFNPKSAPAGTLITVTGTDLAPVFGGPAKVTLNKQGGGTIEAPVASTSPTTLTFVIPTGAATGPITIMVNGETAVSSAPLTIIPASSFTISALPASADLIQGQSVNYAVSLASTTSFNQLAALSVAGIPSGITSKFTPASITAGQTSLLTLTAPLSQPVGGATLTITAAATVDGIPVSQSAAVALSVVAPTTSFLGRIAVDDAIQTPLAGVTVRMLGKDGNGGNTGCTGVTVSDAAGNFILRNLPPSCAGRQLVGYDGLTATSPPGKYAGVNIVYTLTAGQATVSPVVVHLPRIDDKETFYVQQNSAVDQTYAYKSIPGLSVTVYRGTTFTMPDNTQPNPFPLVAVQVPVDRLPDYKPPVPTMLLVFIVAFQPANARASQPVAVYYPNTINTKPATSMTMMTLDPTRGQMVPYGTGVVSPDGTQIVPDLDPAYPGKRYGIVNFDWHGPMPPPDPPNEDPPTDRPCTQCPCPQTTTPQPVNLSNGIETYQKNDISFGGPRGSVSIIRSYRTLSNNSGPFGLGGSHNYGYSLDSLTPQTAASFNLITPEWNRFLFSRQGDGTLRNSTDPAMLGAAMYTSPDGSTRLRWKDGTVYFFGPARQNFFPLLESITDANGNVVTLGRDPNRWVQITSVSDPVGRSLSITYDGSDRILSVTDPIGRVVTYTYHLTGPGSGALATVTDPEGGLTRYEYEAPNRLSREINPRNIVVVENAYDANGRVIQQKYPDGGIYRMQYTLLNPTVATSPVIETVLTDPLGRKTTYRFLATRYASDITDAMGQRTVYERKSGTNLIAEVTGSGSCSSCGPGPGDVFYTHDDATGNILSQTDALGNTTRYTYEPLFNKIATITDPLGNVTRYEYDSRGNLIRRTDANNHTTAYVYNAVGLLTEITDPSNQRTRFEYDAVANLVSTTDATGSRTHFRYDAISRQIEVRDSLGRTTTTDYDKRSRVVRQTDAKGWVTQFAHDGVGNLTFLVDAKGRKTRFTYDGMNRLLTRTTPLDKTDYRTYDAKGNLTKFIDRRGQANTFTHDAQDRVVTETYQDSTVTRLYDQDGRLIRVHDSLVGAFEFTYDFLGRQLSSIGPFGSIKYTRDALGRVKTRQVVGASTVTYSYDLAGNLLSAVMPQASVSFTYDALDRASVVNRLNGVSSRYDYDETGKLMSVNHVRGATSITTQSYAHDAAKQLTGQRTSTGRQLATEQANSTFDDDNRLLTRGLTSYNYDANGNLMMETGPSGTKTYTWDSRNRVTSIALGGQKIHLDYDFVGNLIRQRFPDKTSTFVLDEITNVAWIDDSTNQFSVLTGRTVDSHLAITREGGETEYGLTDIINSTVASVDTNGTTKGYFLYEAFGQTDSTGSVYPFQYTGRLQLLDDLYYYRARCYSPVIGRFISEDPLKNGRSGGNPYVYASNAPTSRTDPYGLLDMSNCQDVWRLESEVIINVPPLPLCRCVWVLDSTCGVLGRLAVATSGPVGYSRSDPEEPSLCYCPRPGSPPDPRRPPQVPPPNDRYSVCPSDGTVRIQ
jgi:RHS repeat-associated protein